MADVVGVVGGSIVIRGSRGGQVARRARDSGRRKGAVEGGE
jgi:hypothetical protein